MSSRTHKARAYLTLSKCHRSFHDVDAKYWLPNESADHW